MKQMRMQEALEKNSNQELQNEFDKLKSKKVEKATTKVVNFYLQTGCGCGESYDKYHAEIPVNKEFESGNEYFSEFPDYMSNVEEGWV